VHQQRSENAVADDNLDQGQEKRRKVLVMATCGWNAGEAKTALEQSCMSPRSLGAIDQRDAAQRGRLAMLAECSPAPAIENQHCSKLITNSCHLALATVLCDLRALD